MSIIRALTPVARRLDSGLLLTLALCAFSLWPLLYRPGLPNGTDVLYHVYRAAEMDRTWARGVLLPNWAESFYFSYGSPVFHYYASLSYYVTSLLSRLFALDAVNSLRTLIALAMLGGGAGMYLFTREYTGKLGGVIAALVYSYSPYILFTEPYARGAYPEMAALALFPLVMWRYARLLRTHSVKDFALAALSSGALILTHNLMALVLTALLVGWLLFSSQLSVLSRRLPATSYQSRNSLVLSPQSSVLSALHLAPFFAVALGIGLTAYFWLPAMTEGDAVRLGNLTGVAGVTELDYRRFFVPLEDLLAASPRVDAGAINGLVHQLNLGLPQWTLALSGLLGVIVLLWRQRRMKRSAFSGQLSAVSFRPLVLSPQSSVLFFALAALLTIFLMLPAAGNVWELVTQMSFLQFPWRFLGPAAFCLAVLAGLNALWLERLPARVGMIATAGIVAFVVGLSLPTFYADEWEHETVDSSLAAYHAAELAGRQRATTFSNEYLPRDVVYEAGATPRLLDDYANGYPVNRAHLETLPPGVTVDLLDDGPQHNEWRVNAPDAFTLEVLTYYFAGWRAEVDGQPVPITPSDPHGMITLPVPAGDHTVRVYLGSTPPRDLGRALTLVSLLALVGVIVSGIRRPARPEVENVGILPRHLSLGLLIGGFLALALMVIFLREGGAWVESPPGQAQLAQHQTGYHLGGDIRLLGYDLNSAIFRPGDRLKLSLYWYAASPVEYGYASFVHISTGGPPLAQADKLNPAGRPTKDWTADGFIRDDYVIVLPETMPPGEYQLTVGLYTCDTRPAGDCGNGDRLAVTDENGQPLGDVVPLANLRIQP